MTEPANHHLHRMVSLGALGVAVCAVWWLGASGEFGGSPGGRVTWESVFAWIQRDWPDVPQMSTAELARRLDADTLRPLLIDTRSREEFAVSHLPGAVWADGPVKIRALLRGVPRERPVVLYCSVGVRSSKAAADLLKDGRSDVSNLRGSIFQWANEGRTVERNGKPVSEVHPYNEKWGALLDGRFHSRTSR